MVGVRSPDKVTADRPSQLQLVPDAKLVDKIWRHFTIGYTLNRKRELFVFGRRGNRIAALRLVSIVGRESDIHMLARQVAERLSELKQELLTR